MDRICSDGAMLWNIDSLTNARALQLAISTTDFVCTMVITNSCLRHVEALTTHLKAEANNIMNAVKEVAVVTATVQSVNDKAQK